MRLPLVALCLLAIAACSKEKEIDPPAELTEFSSTLEVQKVWDASVGGEKAPLRLGLSLAVQGERVYAAGREGQVAAFQADNGRGLWRSNVKAQLSGGPGAGNDLLVVGSSDGQAIALGAADGAVRWKVPVGGEVLAAPAVTDSMVIVRTVDGRLRGLSPADGREVWFYEQPVPRLSLRGTSRPTVVNDLVLCGFDNGKVVAVSLGDGSLVWESTVAPSRGRTELERLVDIDSVIRVVDDDVFVVGFQGRVAMLALDSGQVWWSRDASSYRSLDLDEDTLYFSTAASELMALRRRTGVELWKQEILKHRVLSAPASHGSAVAVADFEGYVHWFDKATGNLVARMQAGGSRVSNQPVVVGDLLLVINDTGQISAFRAAPLPAAAAPAPAPEAAPAPAEPAPPAGDPPPQ
jgi:outer membrane protein assembly factor BamB